MDKPRSISAEETAEIMALKHEDITLDKLKNLFANTAKSKARFNTNDTFILPANKLNNDKLIQTTVGRYVFNTMVLSPDLIKLTGYINHPMNKGKIGALEGQLAEYLIAGKITPEQYIDYIDRMQWLGFAINNFVTQTISYSMIEPIPEVIKERDRLVKENKDKLDAGDAQAAAKIEKTLVDMAEERVKDNNGYEIFESGAGKNFGNNYKNMSIMRGPIKDNAKPGVYNISSSNLVEGIDKDEYHYYADLPVLGSYSRAVGTRDGGYEGKILRAACQTVVLDKPKSDCKSKRTLKVHLTNRNAQMYKYRYIVEGTKLIYLDEDVIPKYIGKIVNMRSTMFCTTDKICSKCAGELYYQLEISNVGLIAPRVGTSLLNSSLKSFHDSTIKVSRADYNKVIK